NQFLQWNKEMKAIKATKFTTKIVNLSNTVNKEYIGSSELNINKFRSKKCLQSFDHLEYENTTLGIRFRRANAHNVEAAKFVINALRSVKSDVMLMRYGAYRFNYSHLKHPPAPLTYAERLVKHAEAAATLLYPYIAVHWRMETAKPDKLVQCSRNLIDHINQIKKKTGIVNVYVATDYPIDGGRRHSGTFHKLTKEHHRAANELKNNVNLYTLERINSSLPLLDNTKFVSHMKHM